MKTTNYILMRKNILTKMAVIMLMLLNSISHAQSTMPSFYFTFDGTTPLKDSITAATLNVGAYSSQYVINANSGNGVGKSLKLNRDSRIIVISQFKLDTALTIEFLFKPDHDFNTTQFISRKDNAFSIKMGYPFIQFMTNIIAKSGGGNAGNNLDIDLLGIGRSSYGYYTDGNWHHIVFKYNTNTGVKEIWVDGQLPDGFSTTTVQGSFNKNASNPGNNDVFINTNTSYYKYFGNIDELALYSKILSPNNIYKHYQDATQNRHYTFTNSTVVPPAPSPISANIDLNEFAPGHPNYSVSPINQLKNFPLPRYKPTHTLLPNFNWIAVRYLSGEWQPGTSYSDAVDNSLELQTELVKNWHYYLMVAGSTGNSNQYNDVTKYHGAWVKLANDHPEWPTSAISLWSQINPNAYGFTSSGGYIENKTLPDKHYVRNNAGQFVDQTGNVNGRKYWSPAAPVDSIVKDGLTQRGALLKLLSALTRPLNFINENGEVIPKITTSTMSSDPAILSDKNASGIADWNTYGGNRKARVCLAYRDQFMSLPQLANTKYTEYQVSGHPTTRHKYSETRFINTTVNNQHYATPDFYPRWPKNWKTGAGAWNGWQHIIDGRYYEIQAGDKLFSPFVAAGWNEDEERNIRPAQWLGLLKCMGMLGAEYYYAGFFNEASSYQPPNPPPANPKGYVWQTAIPTYAQAITSRFEDLLRNGNLMAGDKPANYANPTLPGYSFEAGDERKLVVARKHQTENIYAITGTIQPNSNMAGNAELESDALVTIDGNKLQFKIRRQGSTYIFDNRNPASPVFYQLDGWHESSYPYYWSKDFNFEAELSDNTSSSIKIVTQKASGATVGDYRNANSYVTFNGATTPLEYNFEPRANTKLYLWVRARSVNGSSTGLSVTVDGSNQKSIGCITDTTWKWYSMDACTNQAIFYNTIAKSQKLSMTAANNSLQVDKILLTANATLQLAVNQPTCSGVMATITTSGPTGLCLGDSVKLTASAGTTYLWANGKTTQSIIVTTSGNFTVLIGSSSGCSGTSAPVIVTVSNKPTSTITPSGPTSFCKGESVDLTGPIASSYIWSNGATTQTIQVDSAGNYQLTITNTNGCSATSSVTSTTVNNLPNVTVVPSGPLQLMAGQNVTLTASGGTSYVWTPGGETTPAITVNNAGNFKVTATNASGCQETSDTIKVTVTVQITANITAVGNQFLCPGDTMTLMSDPAFIYNWAPGGATTQSIKITEPGTYKLVIYDANGNTASNTMVVTSVLEPSAPSISINYIPNAAYQLTANTPSAANYIWSNGETTSTINVITPATYSVIAINSFGCKSVKSEMSIGSITGQPCGIADMLTSFDIIDTAATIAWNPAVTGDSFTLTYWINGSGNMQTQNIAGNTSTYRLCNLMPGGNYRWKIQTNCLNLQKTSAVNNFTTLSTPLPCGSIPSNLSATNITTTAAQLNWYRTVATSFTIRYRKSGGANYIYETFNGTTNSSGCSISNLLPNTWYQWSVQSSCNGITTAFSQPSYFSTIKTCGYMGAISVTGVGTSTATITWTNTAPMDTVRLRIINAVTGQVRSITYNATINSGQYVIQQLKPNTAYTIEVKGKCSVGEMGSWTPKVPFTTAPISTKGLEQNPFELSGYPNPASEVLSYTFNSEKKEDYVLKVCDMSGRELFQEVRDADNGSNGDIIDVKQYPSGLYLLILQKGAQASHFRFSVE